MNSTSPRQSAILGLFVAVGLAVVVATLLSVSSLREGLRPRIDVAVTFAEVKGLEPGDAVWFDGVTVGAVRRVGFEAEGRGVRVDLRIDAGASAHIPSDTYARVGTDSLIGNTIVVLYGGSPDVRPLETDDQLAAGAAVTPEAILETLQQSNENLLHITSDLRQVAARLADEEGSLARLSTDDHLYDVLDETLTDLQIASANARTLTGDIAAFTAALDREGTLPHGLVTDRTIHASLIESASSLQDATHSASDLISDLEERLGTERGSAAGVLLADPEAGETVAETLEHLRASSALLEEDLEALQHNFLFRRYFKKREREEQRALQDGR